CEGARDVLRALDGLGAVPLPPEPPEPVELGIPSQESFDFEAVSARQTEPDPLLELELLRVVEAVAGGEADPDSLCLALELPAARIQRALLTLRLRGVLVPGPGGGFVLSNSM
ncbi:MAG: hypothetical protein M3020_02950, partial [Myxococcota bacterium]|nr:hypothetical protein [Myxococcota bacterium]